MFTTDDTIVAIATPPGRAGLGVIRISGPDATAVASRLLVRAAPLAPRYATLTSIRRLSTDPAERSNERAVVDRVVATFYPAPASYTGDDTLELSAHGNPVLLEEIVASAMRAGARLARPGEFTFRAYLNGKIDLVQAEAVADLIEAVTPSQARQAFDQLEGTLTGAVSRVSTQLFDLIVRLEASLDFPDEGYHFIEPSEVNSRLQGVGAEVRALLRGARSGRVIREGRLVVLVGGPNAGKSSLFNALIGADRAIVTAIPGTTRDLVTERCEIGGTPVTLVDTAGLREAVEIVEREGIARTRSAADVAALVLLVIDRSRPLDEAASSLALMGDASREVVLVASKADLSPAWAMNALGGPAIAVSATAGDGLDELRHAISARLTGAEELEDRPSVSNVRHIGLLEDCEAAIGRAEELVKTSAPEELILVETHEAVRKLEEVVGTKTPDDVLSAIFTRFCLGK